MISFFERASLLMQGLKASPDSPPVKSETGM